MEKIELNIVKTPLDPHGRECSAESCYAPRCELGK